MVMYRIVQGGVGVRRREAESVPDAKRDYRTLTSDEQHFPRFSIRGKRILVI